MKVTQLILSATLRISVISPGAAQLGGEVVRIFDDEEAQSLAKIKFNERIMQLISAISHPVAQLGWLGQHFNEEEAQRMNQMSLNERITQLVKTLWPECESMDAFLCKDLIDNQLAQLTFPGAEDIKSVIIFRRSEDSPTSNAIAIPMDDNDLCVGRDGDGLLHYDWDWCGSGEKLTDAAAIEESSKLIKPSKWTKMIEKNPNIECVDGVVVHEKSPNAFGGDFDPNACSTSEGYQVYRAAIETVVNVPPAGCRKIGPFNCGGMSGMDACDMVKHLVPDANQDGKQLECWLSYKPGTVKLAETQTETKVRIYAKIEDKKVIGVPALSEGALGPEIPGSNVV